MAAAVRCDICNSFYEVNDNNHIIKILKGRNDEYFSMICTKEYDCCPKCIDKINDLIKRINKGG